MLALEFYYVPLVPAALLFVVLAIVSVDKYLLVIVFFVPLSIPLSMLTDGLSIDMYLPTEPLLAGLLLLYLMKYLMGDRIDLKVLQASCYPGHIFSSGLDVYYQPDQYRSPGFL